MKFGQLPDSADVDFSFIDTPIETLELLNRNPVAEKIKLHIGLPKFNKKDLAAIYPAKVKEELTCYAGMFNAIEFNATFYKTPSKDQVVNWKNKTEKEFLFFPKVPQSISHYSRLLKTREKVIAFCDAIACFEEQLGSAFLQMHDNYKAKDAERLVNFIADFPMGYPLAIELRNESWFERLGQENHFPVMEPIFKAMQTKGMATVLVDTPGRRDVLHMRLTTPQAFIRFVATGIPEIDRQRLDAWAERIREWHALGLQEVNFFVHQQIAAEIPLYTSYLKEKLQDIS